MFHTFLVGACGVCWVHGQINVVSVYFKDSHFEFRVNQEVTKSHMDLYVSSLDSSSRKTLHGFRNQNLFSIYPRCGVISENVISFRWRPFGKLRHIGSLSQFGDGGIHFSYWDKSQEQNKIGLIRSWGGGGGVGSIGPIYVTRHQLYIQ